VFEQHVSGVETEERREKHAIGARVVADHRDMGAEDHANSRVAT
jgi:hypothetical protein